MNFSSSFYLLCAVVALMVSTIDADGRRIGAPARGKHKGRKLNRKSNAQKLPKNNHFRNLKNSKGSKGTESKSSKSKKGKGCTSYDYLYKDEDIVEGENYFFDGDDAENPKANDSEAGLVPFYDTDLNMLGYWSVAATYTEDAEGVCYIASGSYDFCDEDFFCESQIAEYFTCFGDYNSVTGGFGEFACAGGYEIYNPELEDLEAGVYGFTVTVCGTC